MKGGVRQLYTRRTASSTTKGGDDSNDCQLTDKLPATAIVRCYLYVNVKQAGMRPVAQ